jgi:HAD superfamily hydrolase (TIGR01509 family)
MTTIKKLKKNHEKYPVKGIFFDLDGLLLDTERIYRDGWLYAANQLGLTLTLEDLNQWRGLSWIQTRDRLEKIYGVEVTAQLRETRENFILEQMRKGQIPIKTGAVDMLSLAKEKGLKLAVVSSTVSTRALPLLENAGILNYFDIKVFGDAILQHKPLPDPYLAALAQSGLSATQVLAVEDSLTGALSATRAGLPVFLVPDKSFDKTFSEAELSPLNLLALGQDLHGLAEMI